MMDLSIQHGFWWGTELRLPSWAGYQSRLGPYGAVDGAAPSDGSVMLVFAPEGRDLSALTERERRLLSWFEANEPGVSAAVKAAIIGRGSAPSADLSGASGDDAIPAIADEPALQRRIGLYAINVHQLDVDGVPYVGYEFACDWDEEHGLGVLMHGTRVVEVGQADTATLLWVAEADAERRSP